MIRASKVAPIADAEAGAISNVYNQAAQQAAAERVNKENQLYGTSEREATQKYGTSERMSSQDYNKLMQEYMNQYSSAESQKQRDYETQMANLQRSWAQSDAKKKSKGWWKDALGQTVSTGLGTYTGVKLGQM
jgi:hypothetical protein